ncbi:MAG TPA: DUF4405 domain-containing protein [Candidatus Syntrophosphaera sp.]|nr:DUF4405 domain-containing protein [Candidatus Syntrophosphaera sp.]
MKNNALKFINPILLLLFLIAVIAMAIYKIDQGDAWAEIHEFAGILFFCVGLIHLYYNWGWVRTNIFKQKKKNHNRKRA